MREAVFSFQRCRTDAGQIDIQSMTSISKFKFVFQHAMAMQENAASRVHAHL